MASKKRPRGESDGALSAFSPSIGPFRMFTRSREERFLDESGENVPDTSATQSAVESDALSEQVSLWPTFTSC